MNYQLFYMFEYEQLLSDFEHTNLKVIPKD